MQTFEGGPGSAGNAEGSRSHEVHGKKRKIISEESEEEEGHGGNGEDEEEESHEIGEIEGDDQSEKVQVGLKLPKPAISNPQEKSLKIANKIDYLRKNWAHDDENSIEYSILMKFNTFHVLAMKVRIAGLYIYACAIDIRIVV